MNAKIYVMTTNDCATKNGLKPICKI